MKNVKKLMAVLISSLAIILSISSAVTSGIIVKDEDGIQQSYTAKNPKTKMKAQASKPKTNNLSGFHFENQNFDIGIYDENTLIIRSHAKEKISINAINQKALRETGINKIYSTAEISFDPNNDCIWKEDNNINWNPINHITFPKRKSLLGGLFSTSYYHYALQK